MELVSTGDAARRTRAAIGYAGIDNKDLAAATGISLATVNRIVARKNARGASMDELWAIADACDVPRDFMANGWGGEEHDRLATVERQIRELRDAVVKVTVDNLRRTQEQLERDSSDRRAGRTEVRP